MLPIVALPLGVVAIVLGRKQQPALGTHRPEPHQLSRELRGAPDDTPVAVHFEATCR